MSYAERRLRKARRGKTPEQLHRNRCRICMAEIPSCGGNYRCVHRRERLCLEHIQAARS